MRKILYGSSQKKFTPAPAHHQKTKTKNELQKKKKKNDIYSTSSIIRTSVFRNSIIWRGNEEKDLNHPKIVRFTG